MALDKTEQEKVQIYRKSSYFRNITRLVGVEWADEETAEYEIFNSLGNIIEAAPISKSGDNMAFELRLTNTAGWERGKTYIMTIRIMNSETGYSDVVREVEFLVK